MLCRTICGRVTVGALVWLLGFLAPGDWVGRSVGQIRTDSVNGAVFRPAPRELSLRLSRARKAIETEDYNEAVLELGRLLAESEPVETGEQGAEESQDYFVPPRGEGTHVSLKAEAQRLIGSMPAKGREWYEVQFGAEARKLLEDAARKGDVAMLTNVSRRYFHTKAGYEATLILGRLRMDSGSPLAAALCFRRLADSPVANDFEPELSVLTASCWIASNSPDRAQQTLAALVKKLPGAKLRIGGTEVTLPRDEVQAREQLETLLALRRLERGGPLVEWPLYRGDATRTAQVAGDAPLASARWRLPTANDPNDEQIVEQISKRYVSQGVPALPSMQPLAVQNYVLMRTTDGVWGVDVRTGKRKWPFPWVEMESSPQSLNTRSMPLGANAAARENELRQRLYEDAPYGQMSSDGESVYLLDSLAFASPSMQGPFIQVRPGARGLVNANQLVALDLRREGKLQWIIGDGQGGGGDEPRLAGAFFLGPPLPLHGKLYVLAELNSEVRLVVLDSKTGKLEWQQQLAQVESRGIQQDLTRRLAGASPSYADGVLVCPTSASALVAVELATRTLLWGAHYGQTTANENRQPQPFFNRAMMGNPPKPVGQRWSDATVTIHQGKVLVTPIESDEMYCYDLLTGKLVWPAIKRNDLVYVAAVWQGSAILVGKSQVIAISLETAKPTWSKALDLPEGSMPSGRGFHAGDDYYLPTTNQQLLRIDLKTGTIAQRIRTDRTLGNLICYHDEIISHGSDGMSVYPMVRPLRERVANLLKQNPDDAWALGRMADLAAYDGQLDKSLELLRKACQLHPENESLRISLISSLTIALREDFPKFRGQAGDLERMIDDPAQREQFLRLMAAGLRQVGERDAAFKTLLKLVDLDMTRRSESPAVMDEVTPTHAVRRDRWIAGQLAGLYRLGTPEEKRMIDETLTRRRQEVESAGQVWGMRQFLRSFGFHPQAIPVRLQLASKLSESDGALESLALLASLESHPDRSVAANAIAVSARSLVSARQLEMAAAYYHRLASEYGEQALMAGKKGAEFSSSAVEKDTNLQRIWELERSGWPYGRVKVEESEYNLNRAVYGRANAVQIRETSGATPPGFQMVFDPQKNQSLIGKDGYGRELFSTTILRLDGGFQSYSLVPGQASHAKTLGLMTYAHIGIDVMALSSVRASGRPDEVVRWRSEVVPRMSENDQLGRTKVRVNGIHWGGTRLTVTDQQDRVVTGLGPCTANGVVFQRQREIVCVDPIRGDLLWSRNDLPTSSELLGDEEFVFVIPPDSKDMLVLDMIDGRTLATRPIDTTETRWATLGRRILAWVDQKEMAEKKLRLYDARTGETLFERTYPSTTRGTLVDDRWLATFEPDGQVSVLSLADGKIVANVAGDPDGILINVQFLLTRDAFIVVANGQPRGPLTAVEALSTTNSGTIANGTIYTFDRRTGKVRWPSPARFEQFMFVADQPTESPLLVLMRKRQNNQSSLLVLDRRDGRPVFFRDEIPVSANFNEVTVKPDQNQVTVIMGAKSYTFTMTNDPVAPEAPAQMGAAASHLPGADRSSNGLLNSIFGVFGKGVKSRTDIPAPQP